MSVIWTLTGNSGACDLVLIKNKSFLNGLGMEVHLRTKIQTWWSYIEAAALQIGDSILEVKGGKDATYWINQEEGPQLENGAEFSLSGYKVHFKRTNGHQHRYRIDFGNGNVVAIEVFKDFVRMNVRAGNADDFAGALGMMGHYPDGKLVGRDGKTVIKDTDAMGLEWQVVPGDGPMLFHDAGVGVHHPKKCVMPTDTKETKKRRLGESMITQEDAEEACARVSEEEFDTCVFDVLATNDKEMAGSY